MKTEDFRLKKAVIGTYVPSDLFERTSYYSSYSRAKNSLGSLVERLEESSDNVFISDSHIGRLYVKNNPSVYVAMLEVRFTYDKKRQARKTFREILDLGLMLKCSHITHLSPMIQRGEFSEDLEYRMEEKGRAALSWLTGFTGKFKTVKILGIQGHNGFEYELDT